MSKQRKKGTAVQTNDRTSELGTIERGNNGKREQRNDGMRTCTQSTIFCDDLRHSSSITAGIHHYVTHLAAKMPQMLVQPLDLVGYALEALLSRTPTAISAGADVGRVIRRHVQLPNLALEKETKIF